MKSLSEKELEKAFEDWLKKNKDVTDVREAFKAGMRFVVEEEKKQDKFFMMFGYDVPSANV